jgi:exopolyphosphatase / guanosine-5'-triphosphate,3'-diphosphate pyrophosphatase
MQEHSPPMLAAIDIGSNTIHIVVARCQPDNLDIVEDQVELVRIGESVTATGAISTEKRDAALAVLRQYRTLAEQHSVRKIFTVATEAIRKASNSHEFLEDIKRETGLEVRLISGNAEATLTFYGATYEESKQAGTPARIAVMDLGGGSTELVTARNMHITWRTSLPIGSGWLHDRYLLENPPTPDDLAVAHTFLRTYLQGIRIKPQPPMLIVTGGSANSLLLLARQAFRLDPSSKHLTYDDLMRCEGLMSALPAEEISQRYQQPIGRARILPAGALIIREVMSRLNLDEISVSPHGIREGVLLAYARYGESWLERVNEEASTSTFPAGANYEKAAILDGGEAFVRAGQRMLRERVEKLLDWRDEVLRNEDIEAIHKMRVATRRLRATLDAFESCCDPGQFKKIYRRIKKMADLLGSARDTDVMVQGLRAQIAQIPDEEIAGLRWLIQRLDTYRQQRQQALADFFNRLDEGDLKKQVESCIREGDLSDGES